LAEGFHLSLAPSLAVARTREAMHNSWDKNDPKDAQVLLHLLKTGVMMVGMSFGINTGPPIGASEQQLLAFAAHWRYCLEPHFSCLA